MQGKRKTFLEPCPLNLEPLRGFTFIELVFITLILGILMLAALPRMQHGWSHLQTERTAFQLAQSLRAARVLAIAQGVPVQWKWDADARTVQLFTQQADGSLVEIPGHLGHLSIPAKGVPVSVLQDGQPVETVMFLADGTTHTTTVLLGASAAPSFTIALDGSTSQVAVH